MEVLGPFVPLCRRLGALAMELAEGLGSVEAIEVELLGRIAERDARPLGLAALVGALGGRTEEELNEVNAPSVAEERGIRLIETTSTQARDFTDLVRVTVVAGGERVRVVGTLLGNRNRPHLLEAWGQRFNVQLEEHLALFRYRDVPGMIGVVGSAFGAHGVNIGSAAVGRQADEDGLAAMVVTTDRPVPREVVAEVASAEGFEDGKAVSLR
jgi:D-3-phosphoglycerate dehydrogenase